MPPQEQESFWSNLAIKTLDVYSSTLPSDGVWRETELTENVLLLASGGEGELVINGKVNHVQASFACHLVKGTSFTLTTRAENIHYIMIFYKVFLMVEDSSMLNLQQRNQPLSKSFLQHPVLRTELYQSAETIVSKWSHGDGLERFHINAMLQGLLYELVLQHERSQGSPAPDMVDIVATYIAGHYRKEMELKELAALAGCSVRQLQRRFKQQKQLAPMEYVIQLRMESAARLLQYTDAPISEVAEKAGYRDAYYFSRAFKKYYGVPPQVYRSNVGYGLLQNQESHNHYHNRNQSHLASSYPSAQGTVIRHMRGEYRVTTTPLRIAVMDVQYADHLLALGMPPAGSVGLGTVGLGNVGLKLGTNTVLGTGELGEVLKFPQYIREKLNDTEYLGTYEAPDLQAVARLKTDLIICTEMHDAHYGALSQMAPTLMFKRNESWQTILSLFGELIGKQAEAEHIITAYHRKTALLSEELAEVMAGKSVALIRPRESLVRVHTAAHRTGAVLYRDLGLPAPLFVADTSDTAYHISVDRLPAVHANHYFLLSNEMMLNGRSETEQSVLGMLDTDKQQRIYQVDAATWIGCYGPTGINSIVDQVARVLLA
ncbi:iron complex transport system substrate-binding protein [Paenibacillus turicensis]|uniref:Iron complex transport system substrate-binding protein n=1 Tax=Paenibacillus turicensis TaxID=160487 RepID=A0ABS4FT66_9BACL|nr:AraC family transcriptional regulator [Paenibacillus turicensis]MBP1905778.1 iron complex transport system substrate-binding protein [Paenibacillus turicensis]